MSRIATRFLALVGACILLLFVAQLYQDHVVCRDHIRAELLEDQAEVALAFDEAIRAYMAEEIRPRLIPLVESGDFVPELMSPSFASDRVFDRVRERFPAYRVCFSSVDPDDPPNQGFPEVQGIVERFDSDPDLRQWSGSIDLDGRRYHATFRPARMETGCTGCHGDPTASSAPPGGHGPDAASLRAAGKLVGLQMVALPMDEPRFGSAADTLEHLILLVVGLGLLFLVITLAFRILVSRRLARISDHFEATLSGTEQVDVVPVPVSGDDEISNLARRFNELAGRLNAAHASLEQRIADRTADLMSANGSLAREIAERKETEVALRRSNVELHLLNERLGCTARELKELMEKTTDGEVGLRCTNCSLVRCWEQKGCENESCSVFGDESKLRCWEVAGTFCRGQVQGSFAQKLGDCRLCEVYQAPRADFLGSLGETFNDMLAILEVRQRALEEALRVASAANTAKSEFLANMSHELRTPMNGIIGMAELALENESDSDQRQILETVLESANSLLGLLNDILDLTKIEAQKLDLETIDFDLLEILENVTTALGHRAREKGVELICSVVPEVPTWLRGDAFRLRQVVVNLLGNAVKFTEAGEIRVAVEKEEEDDLGVTLLLSVSDSGIGIPQERQAAIFDVFTQVDGSTTRRFGGTGLGLAISAQLVKLMGGEIWVESELGEGSTFFCRLMFARATSRRKTPEDVPDLESRRILVVDDNQTALTSLETILRGWGAVVSTATRGVDGLRLMETVAGAEEPFDLVLLDAQMPEMDGLEVAGHIAEDSRYGHSPVLIATSHRSTVDSIDQGEVVCAGWLTKPLRRSALARALSSFFGEETSGGEEQARRERNPAGPDIPPGVQILVVEDNPVNLMLATRVLEKLGCEVVAADSGASALRELEHASVDVVFMDVQMPEMDGLEATRRIRANPKWANLPIIAMTAHAMKGDREKCVGAGMTDYLAKPFRLRDLRAMLAHWVPGAGPAAGGRDPAGGFRAEHGGNVADPTVGCTPRGESKAA